MGVCWHNYPVAITYNTGHCRRRWNMMLEKIEVNTENIRKIANADFKQRGGNNLDDMVEFIKQDWYENAEKMLTDYNRVVKILSGDI